MATIDCPTKNVLEGKDLFQMLTGNIAIRVETTCRQNIFFSSYSVNKKFFDSLTLTMGKTNC